MSTLLHSARRHAPSVPVSQATALGMGVARHMAVSLSVNDGDVRDLEYVHGGRLDVRQFTGSQVSASSLPRETGVYTSTG